MSAALNERCNISAEGCERFAFNERPDMGGAIGALNKVSGHSSALTMAADDVAAALGLTVKQLMRKHRSMTAKNGFPRPLPGGIWMWSRAAFEAWVRANGVQDVELDAAEPMATAANDPTAALVREQNASLRMRYGGAR